MGDGASASEVGWRKPYAHVFELSALGCAWEFIRRNPKISHAWSTLEPAWCAGEGDHGLRIVEASADIASPWLWTSSPDHDATTASVVWNPAATDRVLDVVAIPSRAAFGGQVLDLEFVTVEKTLLLSPDGAQQLLLRDGPRSLQLNIAGTSLTEPVALFVDTVVPEGQSETRTRLLECFRKLRTTGTLPRECFPAHPYARRAATVLMALDGHLAAAPHREIAKAMFGEARVERDWSDPGEHLRDAVRRAIARGIILMNGGYQSFLR